MVDVLLPESFPQITACRVLITTFLVCVSLPLYAPTTAVNICKSIFDLLPLNQGSKIFFGFMYGCLSWLMFWDQVFGPNYLLDLYFDFFVAIELMVFGRESNEREKLYEGSKFYPADYWIYDWLVYSVNSVFGWSGYNTFDHEERILANYKRFIGEAPFHFMNRCVSREQLQDWSASHCEIGLGSPNFVLKSLEPNVMKKVLLIDVDDNFLDKNGKLIAKEGFGEKVKALKHDITTSFEENASEYPNLKGQFHTIGCNFVLHCIKGAMCCVPEERVENSANMSVENSANSENNANNEGTENTNDSEGKEKADNGKITEKKDGEEQTDQQEQKNKEAASYAVLSKNKMNTFKHLKALLSPNKGILFGSTILGNVDPEVAEQSMYLRRCFESNTPTHTGFGRALMRKFNKIGIFANEKDTAAGVKKGIEDAGFRNFEVNVYGCIAYFAATDSVERHDIHMAGKRLWSDPVE